MVLYAWHSRTSPFGRLREEMNRLFDRRFFGHGPFSGWFGRGARFPRVNLSETEDALVVECEMPGVARDEVDISVEGGVLTIRGERKPREEPKSESYHRRERNWGPFERSVELPAKVDVDAVKAKLANGILEITLPKTAEAKPRKIDVKHE